LVVVGFGATLSGSESARTGETGNAPMQLNLMEISLCDHTPGRPI